MNLQDEARWVFDKSLHTGQPKTAHAFPVRDTDRALCQFDGTIEAVVDYARRDRFRVGATYCVKDDLKRLHGHVQVTGIERWDLLAGAISRHVLQCGHDSLDDFIMIWSCIHDHDFYKDEIIMHINDEDKAPQVWKALQERPPDLYQAWLVNFEPVDVTE